MLMTIKTNITRRGLLIAVVAGLGTGLLRSDYACGSRPKQADATIPVLHATDLYRPALDPDDHWDLACIYALAHRADINLKGILIDYPPQNHKGRNPDVAAVAQMNFIAGQFVPVAVGSPLPMKSRSDLQPNASSLDHHGVQMVLDVLRNSSQPVIINILGSSRDVAIAGKKDPGLFAAKCAGIYLNAGTGSPNGTLASKFEYNVTLDKFAYAAIFDLPCPVYWMPCFEEIAPGDERVVREYGTHYKFRQDEILPRLSELVQNYFAYMFGRYTDHNWLSYLKREKDEALLKRVASQYRNMWCTAGFLHAAGYTVSRQGEIIPLDQTNDQPVFTFDPITVKCGDDGVTQWSHHRTSKDRFIFHVRNTENYESAMTRAMKSLLLTLP
jgi:hypothetical protein